MKIAAVFGCVGPCSPKEYVERMCKAMLVCDWHTYEVFEVEGGAIGIVRTSERFGSIPMFLRGENGNLLAISGVPTKKGQLKDFLDQIVEMDAEQAYQALTEMDGAYAAIFWDAKGERALFVPDFMGFQPVYLHKAPTGIAIASEIKAFAVAKVVPAIPDAAGWGGFIVFGNTIGYPTQLSGVSRLKGTRVIYSPEDNDFQTSDYWDWPQKQSDVTFKNVPIEPIVNSFRSDVEAYTEYGVKDSTILMSSGLDSRLLFCLLDEKKIPIESLSVKQPAHFFGAEGKLGHKVAKHLGANSARIVLPFTGFENEVAVLQYLIMNDVASPGLGLFISKVAGHVLRLSGSIWEGWTSGNIATNFIYNNIVDYLRSEWKIDGRIWGAAENIFTNDFLEQLRSGLDENIQSEISLYGNDDYGLKKFFIKNRALNRTIPNPLKVYSNTVIPFMPGLSKELWDKVLSLSPYQESGQKILLTKIFKEVYPKALAVPFCNEKGLYMANGRFNLAMELKNILYDISYKWERRHKIPHIGSLIGKKRIKPKVARKTFFDLVLNQANHLDFTEGYLDHSKISSLRALDVLTPTQHKSLNLLFYWVLWHLVMTGEIRSDNCAEWLTEAQESL